MRRRGRKWLEFEFHGAQWKVLLVPTNSARLKLGCGTACGAVTDYNLRIVSIDEDHPPHMRISLLIHELIHVVLSQNTTDLNEALFRCSKESCDEAEENIASTIGPALAGVLTSAKILKTRKS
jgi:Zn-dependent peptidase ImmA (M78 family)